MSGVGADSSRNAAVVEWHLVSRFTKTRQPLLEKNFFHSSCCFKRQGQGF